MDIPRILHSNSMYIYIHTDIGIVINGNDM